MCGRCFKEGKYAYLQMYVYACKRLRRKSAGAWRWRVFFGPKATSGTASMHKRNLYPPTKPASHGSNILVKPQKLSSRSHNLNRRRRAHEPKPALQFWKAELAELPELTNLRAAQPAFAAGWTCLPSMLISSPSFMEAKICCPFRQCSLQASMAALQAMIPWIAIQNGKGAWWVEEDTCNE